MKKNEEKRIAVLIPCYNEAKTIEKVVKDYKKVLQLYMFMIITPAMELMKLQEMPGLRLFMNIDKVKVMLLEVCLEILMLIVI